MELLKSACYFIGVLSVLIIAHEWGHFIVAKLCKMRVDDFSLFFGPKLICLGKRNGTEYNIRSVPLGGFVKIAGMEPEDSAPAGRSILHRVDVDAGVFTWEKYDRSLIGLNDDSFAKINFENLSERVISAVSGAIDDDGYLMHVGKEELQSLLVTTNLNADEHLYIETIIAASESVRTADPDGYNAKPIWQRASVIFAGPLMSLLFGYGLFCAMGFTTGLPDLENKHLAVGAVRAGKPAALAGLKSGDYVLAVNGKPTEFNETLAAIRRSVDPTDHKSPVSLSITVMRAGKELTFNMVPTVDKDILVDEHGNALKGKDGKALTGMVGMIGISTDQVWAKYSLVTSIARGTDIIKKEVGGTLKSIFSKDVKNNVGGIITIGRVINENSQQGLNHVLFTAAMLSVSLGILNLFPIPVLDGGHLMLLLWEALRRRRLTSREVYGAQMVGLCIIGVLFVLVMYNDIVHLIKHQ